MHFGFKLNRTIVSNTSKCNLAEAIDLKKINTSSFAIKITSIVKTSMKLKKDTWYVVQGHWIYHAR